MAKYNDSTNRFKNSKQLMIEKRLIESRVYPISLEKQRNMSQQEKNRRKRIVQEYLMARNVEEKRQILIKNGIIKPLND